MAATDVQSLFLQVDASVELLRRNLASGEQPLDRFEQRANKMAASVDRSIGTMGSRFGDFAKLAESAADRAQRSFDTSFTQIQKMAAKAIMAPRVQGGGLNLGAADARMAAEEARNHALALGMIEQAAQRAAAGEGVMTAETRLYLQAAQAARIEGEQRAAALMREAGALERLEIETMQATGAMRIMDGQHSRTAVSTGQMRAAQQQLTYQLGDAVTMWGLGMRPMQIFISQASQVTGAIGLMTNSSRGFVGFIGGPYMQVLLAAVSVLGVMIASDNDAAKAKDTHKSAADKLREATDHLANSAANANHETRQGIIDSINAAKALREQEIQTRRTIIAQQELARERLQQNSAQAARFASEPGARAAAGGSAVLATSNQAQIDRLEGDIRKQNGAIIEADRRIIIGTGKLIQREVAARTDPRARVEQTYQDRVDRARRAFEEPGALRGNTGALRRELDAAERQKTAGENALKATPKRTGPSAEQIRLRELAEDTSYAREERAARHRLIEAKRRAAGTEDERDRLLREDINDAANEQKRKVANQLSAKKIDAAEAARLNALNEETRAQQLRNVDIDRARETIKAGYASESQSAEAKLAMLRIESDMAVTMAERRRIAAEILAIEQDRRRKALEEERDTSDDPKAVKRANDALAALPERESAERKNLGRQQASPMDQYRARLRGAAGDMSEALEDVKVRGLESVEDGLTGLISGAESAGAAFKRMANGMIADLVRIAVQKLMVNAIGGGFGFLATGGKVEGRAGGGKISGPGTGTSDSILAMLGAKPIMLSNGESIVTADATAKFWPVIDAMNKGRIKGYAGGGRLSPSIPTMPTAPRLPSMRASSSGGSSAPPIQHFHVNAQGAVLAAGLVDEMRQVGIGATIGGSNMAQEAIAERQSQALV